MYMYIYINNKGHVYDLDSYSKLLLQWHMARCSSPVLGHQPLGGIRFLLQIIASMAYEGTHTGRASYAIETIIWSKNRDHIYIYIYIIYEYIYIYMYIYDLDSYSKLLLQWHMRAHTLVGL